MPSVVVAAAASVGAAILLNAAVAKGVSPAQLAGALAELVPSMRSLHGTLLVRFLIVAEVVTAGMLIAAPGHVVTRSLVLILGIFFVAAGVAGRIRGSVRPCGCFGRLREGPMGWISIALGSAYVGLWALLLVAPEAREGVASRSAGCAVALLGLALIGAHGDVGRVVRHFGTSSVKVGSL